MPGRILIIRGGALGDFILTLPGIALIRDAFPDARIEIVGYRSYAALADGRFYADATRCIEYGPLSGFFARNAQLDPELAAYFSSFHQVISYLFDPDEIFASNLARAGVKNLISADPRPTGDRHAAHHLADPLRRLALLLDDPSAEVFPHRADFDAAATLLPASSDAPIAIHAGSGSEAKNWPIEHWITLCRALGDRFPGRPLLSICGESDLVRGARLLGALGDKIHPLECVPLPHLAAVLARCAVFIGHDSGISHLAAASGTPCVLLFGPTDPDVWAPANRGVHIMRASDGQLGSISPTDVLDTASHLLDSTPIE